MRFDEFGRQLYNLRSSQYEWSLLAASGSIKGIIFLPRQSLRKEGITTKNVDLNHESDSISSALI